MVNKELKVGGPLDAAAYWRKRRDFLEPLFAVDSAKVHVFARTTNWMHSKAWIFDDKFAIVGTANVNNRGYTHDSEVSCGIFDVNAKKRWFWAHELRMNLWGKHLGVSPAACRDPVAALRFWSSLSSSAQVARHDPKPDDSRLHPREKDSSMPEFLVDEAWVRLIDPDGS